MYFVYFVVELLDGTISSGVRDCVVFGARQASAEIFYSRPSCQGLSWSRIFLICVHLRLYLWTVSLVFSPCGLAFRAPNFTLKKFWQVFYVKLGQNVMAECRQQAGDRPKLGLLGLVSTWTVAGPGCTACRPEAGKATHANGLSAPRTLGAPGVGLKECPVGRVDDLGRSRKRQRSI